MEQNKAISMLEEKKEIASGLVTLTSNSDEFIRWKKDTEIVIEKIFMYDSRQYKDFMDVKYSANFYISGMDINAAYRMGIKEAVQLLGSMINEIKEFGIESSGISTISFSAIDKVELVINKFHKAVRVLKKRRKDRYPVVINDEYDMQYMFYSYLMLFFDDVRPEDWSPSYAGAASRVDFFLKNEGIVIELKKTRSSMTDKTLGEELIVDSLRYQEKPNCNQIICFVYDPDEVLDHPDSIENDLTKEMNNVDVRVYVRPNH